jgi:hypothetical protein
MIVQHQAEIRPSEIPGSIVLPAAPSVGNLILVFMFCNIATSSITVNSGSWTVAQSATVSTSTYGKFMYRYVQMGDTATLPALWTAGSTYWSYDVYEISGVTGTFGTDVPVMATPAQNGGAIATITANSATSTADNQTSIVATGQYNGNNNGTISQGYVTDEVLANATNYGFTLCAHRFLPTLGTSVNPTVTYLTTQGPCAIFSIIAAFSASSSAIQVMQDAHGGDVLTQTTAAATFGIATTTGRSIVAIVNCHTSSVTGVADDTGTNTYVPVGTVAGPISNSKIAFYLCANAASANTVTATLAATQQYAVIDIYEVAVTGGHLAYDADANGNGTGTAISSGTVTITGSDEIIFAGGIGTPGGSGVATFKGVGYTMVNHGVTGDNTRTFFAEFHNVTASEAATATLSANTAWLINATAFKVGSSAAANQFKRFGQRIRSGSTGLPVQH